MELLLPHTQTVEIYLNLVISSVTDSESGIILERFFMFQDYKAIHPHFTLVNP